MTALLRTENGTIQPKGDPYWGVTLTEQPNPDAAEIPEGMLDAIRLPADLPKIPAPMWGAMLSLFDHVLTFDNEGNQKGDGTTTEAVVILLRGDGHTFPITEYRILVPTQAVGGGYTKQNYESGALVDIITGASFENLPAAIPGWVHAGDIHSHGRFEAYHSGVDDRSDLRQPGLHMVIGAIPRDGGTASGYNTMQSIVRDGRRYFQTFDPVTNEVRDMGPDDFADRGPPTPFHENVLSVVTQGRPTWTDVRTVRTPGVKDWTSFADRADYQPTLWGPLTVWIRTGTGAVYEADYDDLEHAQDYYLTKSNAFGNVGRWIKGEDANAAHLTAPTGGYSGSYRYGETDDDLDASIDAIASAYPALAAFVQEVQQSTFPGETRKILSSLSDASTVRVLADAVNAGAFTF